jgi:hypothetical protein
MRSGLQGQTRRAYSSTSGVQILELTALQKLRKPIHTEADIIDVLLAVG